MSTGTTLKDTLYAQVGRLAKSMANAKRLELVELLCQAPKPVETLATEAGISVTLASAHLKELRLAHVVESEKHGRQVIYRIACPEVASLLVSMRALAQDRLVELQHSLSQQDGGNTPRHDQDSARLADQARRGEVTVIDVRPAREFSARHLPNALSLPLAELSARLHELPRDKPVVAYCRGPFCSMSDAAVKKLRAHGFDACVWREGAADWIAQDVEKQATDVPRPARSRRKTGEKK